MESTPHRGTLHCLSVLRWIQHRASATRMASGGMSDSSGVHTFPPQSSRSDTHHVVFDQNNEDLEASLDGNASTQYQHASSWLDRARLVLARFGRLAGMNLPGISYTNLSTQYSHGEAGRRYGGGIVQDGVFSNINAKPERARETLDPHDRGDDDDLADDTLPPTYEDAAADAAPTYFESTVFGGGLITEADGAWTPESVYIGEPEDMLHYGMTVGTIFAFLWNLFVSSMFQFVGFVLTFLLHSTHAAKFGSRAGLGVALLQYGTDMLQSVDTAVKEALAKQAQSPDDAASKKNHDDHPLPSPEYIAWSRTVCRTIAIIGLILVVESTVRFVLLYVKSARLVAAARQRERDAAQAAAAQELPSAQTATTQEPASSGMWNDLMGFDPVRAVTRVAGRLGQSLMSDVQFFNSTLDHSAEDYVIRPGLGMRHHTIFSSDGEQPSQNRSLDEQLAHHLGLTPPFLGPSPSTTEVEQAHELRSMRFM